MSTDTSVTVHALRALHRIHRQLADLNERLARGPRVGRAHEANLQNLKQQLKQIHEEAHKFRVATDQKQLELKSAEAAIEKRRQQLLQSNDNREYQALLDEIAAAVAAKDVLEVEILEKLEKLDEYQEKIKTAEQAVARSEQEGERLRREVDQQQPAIQEDLARLEGELRGCEAALPNDFRDLYNRVVRARGEDALAAVTSDPMVKESEKNYFCGGCNQQVPLNMVNALRLARPLFCKSCGRLLYTPEEGKG
jgi:hypothetical protein